MVPLSDAELRSMLIFKLDSVEQGHAMMGAVLHPSFVPANAGSSRVCAICTSWSNGRGEVETVEYKLGTRTTGIMPFDRASKESQRSALSTKNGRVKDLRADGQRFLISRSLETGAARPVNICTNWIAGVKKSV
jgi:hypothetical protein